MIGCRLNQSELEQIGGEIRQAGHNLVGQLAEADVVIINTCAVTAKASSDSRQKARNAVRQGVEQVFLTGCWATLNQKSAASIPGVTGVIPNRQKDQLARLVLGIPDDAFKLRPAERQPLPGGRKRTRAFIKIQDGCDRNCTFCATTIARGSAQSVPVSRVLDSIRAAGAGGAQEVILTGVNLGAWGLDFVQKSSLEQLIQSILYHTDTPRIRLSSLEPWGISDPFLDLWQDPRLCQHLHLPLQSGSPGVLKRMARNTNPHRYRSLIARIRQRYPQMGITTDIIVGFPGETELEFMESQSFIREMAFSGGHVFTYSERPATSALGFSGTVPNSIRRKRSRRMRSILEAASRHYQTGFLGQEVSVLWEGRSLKEANGWSLAGRSSENLRVRSHADSDLRNHVQRVRIIERMRDGSLDGTIVHDSAKA